MSVTEVSDLNGMHGSADVDPGAMEAGSQNWRSKRADDENNEVPISSFTLLTV